MASGGLSLVLLLSPGVALASSHDAAQAGFVKSAVDAINSRGRARQKALLHPQSSVCAKVEPLSFFANSVVDLRVEQNR